MKSSGFGRRALRCAVLALLAGCGGSQLRVGSPGFMPHPAPYDRATATSPIKHVILVIQENRSFDNFFARFPGAHGAKRGKEEIKQSGGYIDQWIALKPQHLVDSNDLEHCRDGYLKAWDGGKMDGFDLEGNNTCGNTPPAGDLPYHYVRESEIQPYWDIAKQWVLGDAMFQTQGSGSFTAHQDLIRGGTCIKSCKTPDADTATLVDNPTFWPWGCDAPPKVVTFTLDIYGARKLNGPYPCSNQFHDYAGYNTLATLMDSVGVPWSYYTPCFSGDVQPGCNPTSDCPKPSTNSKNCNGMLLNAFDVIHSVRYGSEWGTNVSWPETNIFKDISKHHLPAVSWVIPADANSDHPAQPCGCDYGPSWVASIVNAVGKSKYWNSSVIIVVWDDWGGFYDNAAPPLTDDFGGLGFRVPMLLLSPYAIAGKGGTGYVAHTQYEFGSIIKYIENNWNLGSLGTSDARATSIGNVLNYGQSPRKFTKIGSKYSIDHFMEEPHTIQQGDKY
jgi:phospholipase C